MGQTQSPMHSTTKENTQRIFKYFHDSEGRREGMEAWPRGQCLSGKGLRFNPNHRQTGQTGRELTEVKTETPTAGLEMRLLRCSTLSRLCWTNTFPTKKQNPSKHSLLTTSLYSTNVEYFFLKHKIQVKMVLKGLQRSLAYETSAGNEVRRILIWTSQSCLYTANKRELQMLLQCVNAPVCTHSQMCTFNPDVSTLPVHKHCNQESTATVFNQTWCPA